jgi:hypothetical protein
MGTYSPLDMNDSSSMELFLKSRPHGDSEDNTLGDILQSGHRDHSWLSSHLRSPVFHAFLVILNIVFCLACTSWTAMKYSHGPQHAGCT